MERRTTDRVIDAWRKSPAKHRIPRDLIGSSLWDHCFLFIPDDEFGCSAVIEYGSQAARAFGFVSGRVNSMSDVPRYLRRHLALMCRMCLADGLPTRYDGIGFFSNDGSACRFRLAVMPVPGPVTEATGASVNTAYILGAVTAEEAPRMETPLRDR